MGFVGTLLLVHAHKKLRRLVTCTENLDELTVKGDNHWNLLPNPQPERLAPESLSENRGYSSRLPDDAIG